MRPEEIFDPQHPRCRYPEFGRHFSEVMERSGKRPPEIARAIGVSPEIIRGYRRGFNHPSPGTQEKLEQFFGETLVVDASDEVPEVLTFPATMTVQRDPSGDLILSVRVSPDQLARFLRA